MQINVGTVPGQAASAEILVDLDGNPINFNNIADISTYGITVEDLTPASLATDVVQIIGSATKTVYINKIRITAAANNAGAIDFYGYKRAALNTGGTSTHPTPVKYDSLNATSTALVNVYSANPSALGTGVMISGTQFVIPGTSGNTWLPVVPVIFEYGNQTSQPLTLRGVNESFTVSLNGQTLPAGFNMYISIEWTEQ